MPARFPWLSSALPKGTPLLNTWPNSHIRMLPTELSSCATHQLLMLISTLLMLQKTSRAFDPAVFVKLNLTCDQNRPVNTVFRTDQHWRRLRRRGAPFPASCHELGAKPQAPVCTLTCQQVVLTNPIGVEVLAHRYQPLSGYPSATTAAPSQWSQRCQRLCVPCQGDRRSSG